MMQNILPHLDPASTSASTIDIEAFSPLITVATVVWNAAGTLEDTILSVVGQTLKNFEYIVIDGGSTDGTLDILAKYRGHISTLIIEKDKGIYDAMNKALLHARGQWLLFLGADDLLATSQTLEQVAVYLRNPTKIYYGDVTFNSTGRRYCGRMSTYRLMQQNLCHQAVFYPAEVFRSKLYDLNIGLLADYKYNIELWASRHPFHYLDFVIARFEDRGASSKPDQRFELQRIPLIRQHFGWHWALIKRCRTLMVKLIRRPQ